ncbi:hypothetical protein KAR91_73700 [Candidatus Pacearchaeota archaeon]|nr:hypothetical protein [Candidatus Pacearchaeota archaeon]
MNYSTAIFLTDAPVRSIAVTYEKIDMSQDTTKQMKYTPAYLSGGSLPNDAVVFKTMDTDVKIGDFVIVPTDTRHGMTVCKVVGADFEIDFESDKECHWIVGTVNTLDFEKIRQLEEKVIIKIKDGEVNNKRAEMRKSLEASMGGSLPTLTMIENETTEDAPE